MSLKPLVVVESPTKARTIGRFLGGDYRIEASNGHIRDLPERASDISPEQKKQGWTSLGIRIEKDFEPLYLVPSGKQGHVKKLKEALKGASELYLATDEDREGESISWHLLQLLKPKVPVKRLVFHEITKEAIQHALASARDLDEDLVRAQETRRIVDRLYGFKVSEILWRKMAQGLSAGRVQSVAVRILVERTKERMAFKEASFFGISGLFSKDNGQSFEAELVQVGDRRVAVGRDFDPKTGLLNEKSGALWLKADSAEALATQHLSNGASVTSVEEKPYENRPSPPFVTSTLQQEANRKLRMSASRTMSIAQQLYENGFITYMRTDSTALSDQAINAARSLIAAEYGPAYLPPSPRLYKTSVKNAQEAHEAIRPAGDSFTSMDKVRAQLGPDAGRLYELIWKRTIASQMNNSRGMRITVHVSCGDLSFRASGKTIEFPGYIRAYVEGSDNPETEIADQEKILPKLTQGEVLAVKSLDPVKKSTQPPAHYTEGSLIKELEARGIGRPSTWATVVETVVNRAYAFRRGNQLIPTFTAFAVYQLLLAHFENLIDFAFTAHLEDDLDAISRGEKPSLDYLKRFYFGNGHPGLQALLSQGLVNIDPRAVCGIPIGNNDQGISFEVRIGRHGPYITNGANSASLPDEFSPEEMTVGLCEELLAASDRARQPIGHDPVSGQPVYIKSARGGYYLQLGDGGEESRARTSSLLPNMKPEEVTLDIALRLLSLPRDLGKHPETGEMISAALGRFGPYLRCGSKSRSIDIAEFSPLTISFEQAIEVLARENNPRGRRASSVAKSEDKVIGVDPETGKEIKLKTGRYGPYITDGEVNASYKLKSGDSSSADGLPSLSEAAEILAAKRLAGPPPKKARKARATKSEKSVASKEAKPSARKSSSSKAVTRAKKATK